MREICNKWDILLIVDETMTGFGRTGKMFATEHYDIVPDIMVVGKALGVYVPLTAAIFSHRVAKTFEENLFGHGQSYSGHALACAAALAGIKTMQEDGIVHHAGEMGEYLGHKLTALAEKHPSVGDVRGMGLFWRNPSIWPASTPGTANGRRPWSPSSSTDGRGGMPRNDLSNRIRRLRFDHGEMTQQALARRVGVTRQTIIALEANRYAPSLPLALRIARVFGVAVEEVFQLDDGRDA